MSTFLTLTLAVCALAAAIAWMTRKLLTVDDAEYVRDHIKPDWQDYPNGRRNSKATGLHLKEADAPIRAAKANEGAKR
jgi:hypothetical protein